MSNFLNKPFVFLFWSVGLWVTESFRAFPAGLAGRGRLALFVWQGLRGSGLLKLQSKSKYVFHPLELCTSLNYNMVKTLENIPFVRGL